MRTLIYKRTHKGDTHVSPHAICGRPTPPPHPGGLSINRQISLVNF
jgi:hypothetical protein